MLAARPILQATVEITRRSQISRTQPPETHREYRTVVPQEATGSRPFAISAASRLCPRLGASEDQINANPK